MTIGTGERTIMPMAVFRLFDHCSIGPSDVVDPLKSRIRVPVSPPPCRNSVVAKLAGW
jgi:hypothetical protein